MDEDDLTIPYEESKDDVHYLHSLIDKFVSLEVVKNYSYSGFVHSIDPVSRSIILLTPSGDNFSTILVPGHAVLSITEKATNLRKPARESNRHFTDEEISGRKLKTIGWLKKNLLPVSEKGNIIDMGHVSILPPYTVNDICTENPVVVLEIRKLIENMPDDFVP